MEQGLGYLKEAVADGFRKAWETTFTDSATRIVTMNVDNCQVQVAWPPHRARNPLVLVKKPLCVTLVAPRAQALFCAFWDLLDVGAMPQAREFLSMHRRILPMGVCSLHFTYQSFLLRHAEFTASQEPLDKVINNLTDALALVRGSLSSRDLDAATTLKHFDLNINLNLFHSHSLARLPVSSFLIARA